MSLRSAIVALLLALAPVSTRAAEPAMTVTLLGTGTPTPREDRFSAAILVEAGPEKLVFDMGRGVTIRLWQKRVPFGAVTAHFITHLHSDHIVGLTDLWLTGWLATPYGSRKSPMTIFGPRGTVAMTANLTQAFAEDIRIRTADEHLPAVGVAFDAHDIEPGPVFARNGVTVTAFPVNHGEKIKPAFGYAIEYGGHKVVLSGDTKYDPNVARAGRGADLLVHEVADIDPGMLERFPTYREIANHHSSPEDAGRVFTEAGPKLAVYSHIVFASPRPGAEIDPDALAKRTRTTYSGPLVVGQDLMSFTLGERVRVRDREGRDVQPY